MAQKIQNVEESVKQNELLESPTLLEALPYLDLKDINNYKKSKPFSMYDFIGYDERRKPHTIIEIKNRTNSSKQYDSTIMGFNKYEYFCQVKLNNPTIKHIYVIVKFNDCLGIYDFMDNENFRNNVFEVSFMSIKHKERLNKEYFKHNIKRNDRNIISLHLFILDKYLKFFNEKESRNQPKFMLNNDICSLTG